MRGGYYCTTWKMVLCTILLNAQVCGYGLGFDALSSREDWSAIVMNSILGHSSACDAEVRLGILVERPPSFCPLSGSCGSLVYDFSRSQEAALEAVDLRRLRTSQQVLGGSGERGGGVPMCVACLSSVLIVDDF